MTANFFMQDQNITMTQGDTLAFGLEIVDQYGEALDADSAYLTAKKSYEDACPSFQISTTASTAGQIKKESTGKYSVRVAPAATSSLEAGLYHYDLSIHKNSDVFTVMRGVIELLKSAGGTT